MTAGILSPSVCGRFGGVGEVNLKCSIGSILVGLDA